MVASRRASWIRTFAAACRPKISSLRSPKAVAKKRRALALARAPSTISFSFVRCDLGGVLAANRQAPASAKRVACSAQRRATLVLNEANRCLLYTSDAADEE